jgi:hypothetical protein
MFMMVCWTAAAGVLGRKEVLINKTYLLLLVLKESSVLQKEEHVVVSHLDHHVD